MNEEEIDHELKDQAKEPEKSEENLSQEEVENGKNKYLVKCKFCPSKILNPGMGTFVETKFDLPLITSKSKNINKGEDIKCETLNNFWQINNMYTFENIGFSNTVENIKYLACADCEVGPVGYFNTNTEISYIALERVNHVK